MDHLLPSSGILMLGTELTFDFTSALPDVV